MKTVSVIILNWNGKELLAECLPSVQRAQVHAKRPIEVIIVDNGSQDGSVQFVHSHFPDFKIVELESNRGFSEGNNQGAHHAKGDLLVFLNNDMIVEEGFLPPLLSPFDHDATVFAVASQVLFSDPQKIQEETGKTYANWDHGIVRFLHQPLTPGDRAVATIPVFWAGGGAAAFDREKFHQLGGFQTLYSPAYVEDADLSYRAWKRGWKVLLAPESRVVHKHRSSTKRLLGEEELEILVSRNQLLFIWCNITSTKLLLEHLFTLPLRIARNWRLPEGRRLRKALRSALPLWHRARAIANSERSLQRYSDASLLLQQSWKTTSLGKRRRPHILVVCPYVPSLGRHAGAGRMYQIIKGISSVCDVSVLTFLEEDAEQKRVEELKQFCWNVRAVRRGGYYPVNDLLHLKPVRRLREFVHPEMIQYVREALHSGLYDLVQYEYLETGYLHTLVGPTRTPSILTHHEVQHRSLRQLLRVGSLGMLERIQRRYEWMKMLNFELSLARRFDRVITMTYQDGEALACYNPRIPVTVIETGVDVNFFANFTSMEPQDHSLAFLGYYKHYPNVDAARWLCSEIVPRLQTRSGTPTVYLIGSDPPEEIRLLHNGRTVIVTGRVDDVRPYLARSCVFVVPIRLGAGIRGKILEAWAMKKPVVSTTLGCSGLRAMHEENLLIADSPDQFADAIDRLFRDYALRQRLGENGFVTVQTQYDWSYQIQKQLALYEEVLGRSIL